MNNVIETVSTHDPDKCQLGDELRDEREKKNNIQSSKAPKNNPQKNDVHNKVLSQALRANIKRRMIATRNRGEST